MAKPQMHETKIENEKAVLIGIITQDITPEKSAEYLDELEFLAKTADVDCVKRFTQRVEHPNSRIYLGQGKIDEIAKYIED
ncbi:MAG: GTPase HflX, partial [Bacteroidales bacterium]|nr:GTPase HflX [Bacteroidales bacterium]